MYEQPTLCAKCGGKCCMSMPGSCSPDDVRRIGRTDDLLVALVETLGTEMYAIDWWEGDPRPGKDWDDDDYMGACYYIRPAHVGVQKLYHASWGGQPCTFLQIGVGCELDATDRPQGCRELEPGLGEKCVARDGGKHGAAMLWLPYQSLIERAADKIGG